MTMHSAWMPGDPMPDPRSKWQPAGVHGPSRLVEHPRRRADRWRGFPLREAIIYELHIGTFTPEGTFDAAIGRLDHVKELGVNAIEIMPVAEFAGRRGWGYDGVDLYAPHHSYGGPEGLHRLIEACHARGGYGLDAQWNDDFHHALHALLTGEQHGYYEDFGAP